MTTVADPVVPASLATRIAALPKLELHLHLEGSMRPATVLALAERHGVDIGCTTEEELAARFAFRDFLHFLDLFIEGLAVLRTPDDIVFIADRLVDDLVANHVRYAEVFTTAYHHMVRRGMAAAEYAGALDDAQRRAAARGVELRWIADISRGEELPEDHLSADFITGRDAPVGGVALGIGGPEAQWPAPMYADTFARARATGMPVVAHAGEAAGPQSVIDAIDVLGAVRIGHGVRSVEDPALVERLAAEGVHLEVSPTSNVLLSIVPSIEAHPIGALLAAGVRCSINTDDPGYFRTDLNRELALVCQHHALDEAGLASVQRNALDASFADAATRARLAAELSAWEQTTAP